MSTPTPSPKRSTTARRRTVTSQGNYAVETAEPRRIILEIEGDTLSFRHFGSGKRYRLGINRAMQEAMLEQTAVEMERGFFAETQKS